MSAPPGLDGFVAGFDYPMFVVTAADPGTGHRAGCLVGFATQASIEPFRFLVCLSRQNHTFEVAYSAPFLAVHVLDLQQQTLAELFGSQTGDEVEKFDHCAWRPGPGGVPLLLEAPRRLVGRVLDRFDLGDHQGFLLEPADLMIGAEADPLSFQGVTEMTPGHPAG
ncbi:MAG: flavin reductase family protein [Streptosporangiaceae bacterium]